MLDKVGLGLARLAEQESLSVADWRLSRYYLRLTAPTRKMFLDLLGSARSALDPKNIPAPIECEPAPPKWAANQKNIPGPKEPDSKSRQLEK
jgi:hypothetical protein